MADLPNDTGGYAADLAAPPAKIGSIDVARNVELGTATDSRDPVAEPEHEHEPKPEPKPDKQEEATSTADQDAQYAGLTNPCVAVQTNQGTFYLELWPEVAPKHVENLLKLAKDKFYDGILIHRVDTGYVVQMGDPFTKSEGADGPDVGTGGPGYNVKAEFNDRKHLRGTLSMARSSDPDSAGSQFFICLDRAEGLDHKYTVFGQVLGDGMEVVDDLKVGDRIEQMRVVNDM